MAVEFLTKKYGPLPGYGWVVIAGVPVIFLVFRKPKQTAAPANAALPASPVASGIGGASGSGGSSSPTDFSPFIDALKASNEQNAQYFKAGADAQKDLLGAITTGQAGTLQAIQQGNSGLIAAITQGFTGFASQFSGIVTALNTGNAQTLKAIQDGNNATATQFGTLVSSLSTGQSQLLQQLDKNNSGLLSAIQQGNNSSSGSLTNLIGTMMQTLTTLASAPKIVQQSAPYSAPGNPYNGPVLPPIGMTPPTPLLPPAMPFPMMPNIPLPIFPTIPNGYGSYQMTPNGYIPVNPGPIQNIIPPNANNRVTVFNGNGQVWRGIVPA